MKVLRLERHAIEALVWRDEPEPEVGPGEVLVAVHAVSLNYRDLAMARGQYPGGPLPLVPGSDAAGEVLAAGAGVTRAAVGDAVLLTYVIDWLAGPVTEAAARRRRALSAPGVMQERVVVPEAEVVRAPRGWSAAEAATLPIAATTAWQALMVDGRVAPGDDVVVQGTGGVSLFALDFAALAGARVWMVTRDERHAAVLRARGAAGVLAVGARGDWSEVVLAKTAGRGADAVVDVVGGAGLNQSIAAARVGGTVHVIGFVGGGAAPVDLLAAIRRAVVLRAASVGSRESLEALVRALEVGGRRPVVDRVFGAEEVREAFTHLERGGHLGKIVVALR